MKIEYEIKGIKLTEWDMYDIKKFYEAHCTAEYILENYDVTEEKAIELGYEVRRLMDKYDYYEEDAIDKVMADNSIDELEDEEEE